MQVDRQDRLRSRRDRCLDQFRIHCPGVGINVDKNGLCAAIKNCRRRRHKRHGDRDHLVAGTNSGREQREVQRRSSAIDRHAMFGAAIRSETLLEGSHLWAEHKMSAIDDLQLLQHRFPALFAGTAPSSLGTVSRAYSFLMDYRTWSCVIRSRSVMSRAGTPATIAFGATSRVTTAPAPILAPSPMVTPHKMVAFDPMAARRQTRVGSTSQSAGPCSLPSSVVALGNLIVDEHHAVSNEALRLQL